MNSSCPISFNATEMEKTCIIRLSELNGNLDSVIVELQSNSVQCILRSCNELPSNKKLLEIFDVIVKNSEILSEKEHTVCLFFFNICSKKKEGELVLLSVVTSYEQIKLN
jgi:hypothetical protein